MLFEWATTTLTQTTVFTETLSDGSVAAVSMEATAGELLIAFMLLLLVGMLMLILLRFRRR